jgi:hypothetical protein
MKRKISGYYGYWCHVKKKRIFKTLYVESKMTQTVVNIVYAEITAIVVMCIVIYLMYLNKK